MTSSRILIAAAMTVFVCSGLNAQVAVPDNRTFQTDRSIFGVGLSAGLASGFGLSFRHHPPGNFSYQLVGGIIKADTKLHADVGIELQHDFVKGEYTRFFASGALGFFFSGHSGHNDLAAPVRMGAGIGGEWLNLSPFHFASEILFTYFSDGTILPLPQFSAHYYFF